MTTTTWAHRTNSPIRVPDLDRPQAVTDVYERYSTYGSERRALSDAPNSDAVSRRRSALGLLVNDTRAELATVLDAHLDAWRTALDTRAARTRAALDAAVTDLTATRVEVWASASVLAWLDRPDHQNYSAPRIPALDIAQWDSLIAELRDETGNTTTAPEPTRRTAEVHAQSLRFTAATFPDLDRPDAIDEPYRAHRAALDRHHQLGQERRALDATRNDAVVKDRRAFADHIAAGKTGDPGTPNADALDGRLGELDLQRAQAQVVVQDTYKAVMATLSQHRDQWRTTVTTRHAAALRAYRTAIDAVTDTRQAMHDVTSTRTWLDTYQAGERPAKVTARQPAVAGHQWADVQRSLIRDAESFGSDAA